MEFANLLFLYLLLPIAILVYTLIPGMNRKNWALIVISLVFYAMGQPVYMALMVGLTFLNYKLAFRIHSEDRSTILIPLVLNLGVWAGFKYITMLLESLGVGDTASGLFPVGLSVYFFSVAGYMLDVYSRKTEPEEKFRNLLLYFMMFPKLLQGPVVRYEQLRGQLQKRRHHPRFVFEGLQRFVFGLAKKVLLADTCGRVLAEVNASGADTTLIGVWFAAILFMFQIYYDFSGYSDMAIGLGKVFGFRYCENFRHPYLSLSVEEFCQKWNMSLGGFFRDYVYLPLGGDRVGKLRQLVNLVIVCLLYGLWHGIGWNYLLWGLFLFAVLSVEKYIPDFLGNPSEGVIRSITLWLILVGWIIFSHEKFSDLQAAVAAMLGYGGMGMADLGLWILKSLPVLLMCIIGCTTLPVSAKQIFAGVCGMAPHREDPDTITPLRIVYLLVSVAVMGVLLWLCTVSLVTNPALPSIYGRF